MHFLIITRFTGLLILFLGISMAAPLIVSLIYDDGSAYSLGLSMIITSGVGIVLYLSTRHHKEVHLNHRDGVTVVTLGWIMSGLVGTLPFLFSGSIPDFTDAYFESMSGFTTTGSSVLADIEGLPEGILFWRSQTQWLGGMGIIVLSIAILPFLGVGGMQLYKAEIPGPLVDKLKPRISETAKTLWKVYVLITLVEVILLFAGGMSLFDAVCHAFCSMPTGGFSTKNASIAYFGTPYLQIVLIVFMMLAGINFSLHYRMIKGNVSSFYQNSECRTFLILTGIFALSIAFDIHGALYHSFFDALMHATFQVSSIITTTGFVTADYAKWPPLSQAILLVCMFLGAMAGSTGGGIKIMRVMLLFRQSYKEVFRIIHPHAVTVIKLEGRPVSAEILSSIWGFFTLYMILFVIGTFIMSFMGLDIFSAFASVAASIGNIGPGFGTVGPVHNYSAVPLAGKWVLVLCMLLGRLEIYTVIVLFLPEFWRK
ncbi:MAG: TrkH family potassium uptake protein [Desulfatiglans sp.]|nr:TrkH family potassium uptake protein [Thermodesulfobacteriota bacterium]MEE4354574.1 TrkH family potassium uptake protein [Desulfatiglans sp.]